MKIYEYIEMFNKKPNLPSYIQKKKFHNPALNKNKKNFNILGYSFDSSFWKINKENSIYKYILNLNFKKIYKKLFFYLIITFILYFFFYDETMYCFESQFASLKAFLTLTSTFVINYLNTFGYIKTANKIKKLIKWDKDVDIDLTKETISENTQLKIIYKCILASDEEVKKQPLKSSHFRLKTENQISSDLVIVNSKKIINEVNKISSETLFKDIDINTSEIFKLYIKSSKYSKWFDKYFIITPQTIKDFHSLSTKFNQINLSNSFKNFEKINFFKYNNVKNNIFIDTIKIQNLNKLGFFNFKLNFKISTNHKFNFYQSFSNLCTLSEIFNLQKYPYAKYFMNNFKNRPKNNYLIENNSEDFFFIKLNSTNIKLFKNNNLKKKFIKKKLHWWLFKN